MEPLVFAPLYIERVWGGRELERIYGRTLPQPDRPYGESWEIVDRENEQSVVSDGPLAGKTLHELWMKHREEIFGEEFPDHPRFPILIKVLDARDDLSIQVHPPADIAEAMKGEAKTEMWFIADCDPGARLYVGLKSGIQRADFEQAIRSGNVAECVHAIEPVPGECIFIPSGRLHAIGAGFLIHEIQQNSDTTYRVFDWNRPGLDGKPRELHVSESLASIDFNDHEPTMDIPDGDLLSACEFFRITRKILAHGDVLKNPIPGQFSMVSLVEGSLKTASNRTFKKGDFFLLPRSAAPLFAIEETTLLQVTLPLG